MKQLLCLLFCTASLLSSLEAQESLDAKLAELHEQSDFPGWAIAVVDNEKLIYSHTEGYADLKNKIPFTDETVMNIASVSKTFISHAMMQAVSDGLFTLDTPINELLPFPIQHPQFPDTDITMAHLVTHSSGIQDRTTIYYLQTYIDEGDPDISLDEFMRYYFSPTGKWNTSGNFTKYEPGTHYKYSNIGATLAAWIIELQSGMPFYEYSAKYTLEPIGMDYSGWRWQDINKELHTVSYKKKNKVVDPYHLATYPDGGLRTNIRDLSKYIIEMIKGYNGESTTFSHIDYSAIFTPIIAQEFPGMNEKTEGVGVFWNTRSDGLIRHTGSDPGVTSVVVFNPETGIAKKLLTNLDINGDKQVEQFRAIWYAVDEVYK
jgi:CubicO group peptidase (beta-lactamase class C family)